MIGTKVAHRACIGEASSLSKTPTKSLFIEFLSSEISTKNVKTCLGCLPHTFYIRLYHQ